MEQKDILSVEKEKEVVEKLVLSVQKGEVQAFAKIYDQFVEKIYKYFYYKTAQEEAFDLTENVFLKAWDNIKSYQKKPNSSFSAWLFRIAHNLLVDHYRLGQEKLELKSDYADQRVENSPVFLAEQSLSRGTLKKAMQQLKPHHREMITLAFIQGFSNEEIAEILNKSEGSLRVLKFRALRDLKRVLEEMGIKY